VGYPPYRGFQGIPWGCSYGQGGGGRRADRWGGVLYYIKRLSWILGVSKGFSGYMKKD